MESVTRGCPRKSFRWFKELVSGSELVPISSVIEQLSLHPVASFVLAPDHLGGKYIIQVYFRRDEHHHSASLSWECHPAGHEDHRSIRWVVHLLIHHCPHPSLRWGGLVPWCRKPSWLMNLPREQRVVVEKELSQVSSPPLGKIRFTSNIVVTKPQEGLLLFFSNWLWCS